MNNNKINHNLNPRYKKVIKNQQVKIIYLIKKKSQRLNLYHKKKKRIHPLILKNRRKNQLNI